MAKEAGADMVAGHHPHVIQTPFYSLGNFVFDQDFSKATMEGRIAEITIKNKKIEKVNPINC